MSDETPVSDEVVVGGDEVADAAEVLGGGGGGGEPVEAAAPPEPVEVAVEVGDVMAYGPALLDVAERSPIGDMSWMVVRDGQALATDTPAEGDVMVGRADALLTVAAMPTKPLADSGGDGEGDASA